MEPTFDKPSDFVRLLSRAQEGEEGAAQRLYEEYGPHIRRVVRKRLQRRLRSRFDSMDFVHDVWGWFLTKELARYDLKSPNDLVQLLTVVARRRVADAARGQTPRHDPAGIREGSLEETHGGGDNVVARQQTPSQIVMGEETWQLFLNAQPPVWRRVLILARTGRSNESIAEELGIHLRTVQRILRNLLS